jgi:hypothetical protein
MTGIEAGRRIREAVHGMPLAERARPCTSRLKPEGNVGADRAGEEIGIRHLEMLSNEVGHRIQVVVDGTRAPLTIGSSTHAEVVWAFFDAIDGTVKVAGIGTDTPAGRLRAANDGGWASAMAFTAPTDKPLGELSVGDFIAAAIVDGNPPRYPSYPSEVVAVRGVNGLDTCDVSEGRERRVFTSSIGRLGASMTYLDGFQAFDRASSLPGDEDLAVELYRILINRNEPSGAYDVLRQYSNLNALQRTMLGWREEPVWHESQGSAFIALNENLTNLIPAVAIIEGAGGVSVDFDNRPIRQRMLKEGRASVVHAANEPIRTAVLDVISAARQRVRTRIP